MSSSLSAFRAQIAHSLAWSWTRPRGSAACGPGPAGGPQEAWI